MDKLVLVGHGNTADVYEWSGGNCLKLFKPEFERNAEKEYDVTRQIMKTNVRIPDAKEIIYYNGRRGIVYEKINGTLMYSVIMSDPSNIGMWGQMFADIHYSIHSCSATSLSSPREEIIRIIENCNILSSEARKRILSILQSLTDESVLCHGDFHPLNIIMTKQGPCIIDWMNSRAFHPLADVALSSVILQVAGFPNTIQKDFHENYVKRYLQLSSYNDADLLSWQIPLAVVRLNENKKKERDSLIRLIEKNLRLVGF